MATLDDRLLGEKLQYYCSSSEDEDEDDEEEEGRGRGDSATAAKQSTDGPLDSDHMSWEGSSTNASYHFFPFTIELKVTLFMNAHEPSY